MADNLPGQDGVHGCQLNKAAVAFLEANEGVNAYDGFGTLAGTPTGSLTNVAAAQMTLDAVPQLHLVGEFNYMANPFILSGTNLNVQYQLARLEAGNGEGKGAVAKANEFRTYFDPVTIDHAADAQQGDVPDRPRYDCARYARVSPGCSDGVQGPHLVQTRQQEHPGRGVRHRVRTTCSGDEMYHQFLIKCNYAFLINPEGCVANRTGILKFAKV